MPHFHLRTAQAAVLGFALAVIGEAAIAQAEPAVPESAPEEVLVTGEFPGPGLWKVTRADDADQHVLWILGLPPPLPKRMEWKSSEVEAVIAQSQEVLLGSTIDFEPDKRIGFFKGLSLLPAALKARKNPEQEKLEDLLPADLYQRWEVLKKEYLGRDSGIEKWRPIFAADKLRREALDDLKLRDSGVVIERITALAEKHKVPLTRPTLKFAVETADIKSRIKEFSRESLADTECFATTLTLVEALSDRITMQGRANAWATGYLSALLGFEPLPNPMIPCLTAVMASQVAQELIPSDILQQLKSLWFEAAERSLATNRSTLAVMSLGELTSPDGQLAALRARGYVVEEPQRD